MNNPRKTEFLGDREPRLFQEKTGKKKKAKLGFFVFVLIIGGYFLFSQRGVEGEGVLQAEKFLKVSFANSGVLSELLHEKGERVKKGDLIARFTNSELTRQYSQQTFLLEKLKTAEDILKEKVKFFRREKERKRILLENQIISLADFEKGSLDLTDAEKELSIHEKEIQSVEEDAAYLRDKVDSLKLKAPMDGILLTDPGIHIGSPVKEGEFVLELADPRSYFLEILISEKDIEKIQIGSLAELRFHAIPNKKFSGKIVWISPRTIDEIDRVFKIRHVVACKIELNQLSSDMKYGMRASVVIKTKNKFTL